MRPHIWIYPYSNVSESALALADKVGGLLIKRENSKYRRKPGDWIINWGCTAIPEHLEPVCNSVAGVRLATNKLWTFNVLLHNGIQIPEFTELKALAQQWLESGKVVARKTLTGSQGHGIQLYKKGSTIDQEYKLFTKYVKKEREFRVHVMLGDVVFEQEKMRKNEDRRENYDRYIRSHDRGWCFVFHHLVENPVPQQVRQVGVAAVQTLGLFFGAVDIGWSAEKGATVFEVNTAPGIEESSLEAYANRFKLAYNLLIKEF